MLTGMNWFDGAEYCYYQNAILAEVPDLATQTFLEIHAADIHNGNPEFWLGATDIFTVSYSVLPIFEPHPSNFGNQPIF